jgi:hypothetical protein
VDPDTSSTLKANKLRVVEETAGVLRPFEPGIDEAKARRSPLMRHSARTVHG